GYVEVWPDQSEFEPIWSHYLDLCRKSGNKGPSGAAKKPQRERTFFGLPLNDFPPVSPAELDQLPPRYEGAERQVTRNIRERDPEARADAEAYYRDKHDNRLLCEGCKIEFGKIYGQRGEGFMHFHHKKPLAESDGRRQVSGRDDLVPLCPNCHAMVHRGEKLLTVEQLIALIVAQRS
ncbi:MAG: HNH endonuclease, partial [Deltaproteobacteria bacterium]